MMKKILSISLSLFLIWGCGGGSDDPAPTLSVTPTISWNMSSTLSVEENTNGATLIDATLNNTTSSVGLSFSLSGTDSSKFSVSSGYLVFSNTPDYEDPTDSNTDNSYSLTITAAGGGISSTQSVTVNVTNVNEAPVITSDGSSPFNVNENATTLTTIEASDPESDAITYSLQNSSGSQDEALLTINSSTGEITFKNAPNFESPLDIDANNSLVFTVVASHGNESSSKEFYASINNVSERATDITIAGGFAAENSAGAEFGVISIVDEDNDGIKSIQVTDSDGSCFTLGSGLNLKFCPGNSGDYETKKTYNVEVTLEDTAGLVLVKTLTLTLTDVNESPTSIAVSSTALENLAGASFGTLSTSDPDAGDTFSYSITGGTDSSSFEIGSGNELKFKSTVSANFETKSSYSVTITSTDSGSLSVSNTLTVSISNVNETPTAISLSGSSASENVSGASFGTLSTSDPDSSDTFTYTISDGLDGVYFEIGTGGILKFKSSHYGNFENKNVYSVTVTSTDSGSLSVSRTLNVTITNVNEQPAFSSVASVSVAENGTAVITATANDPEVSHTAAQSLSFSLGSGNDSSKFNITSAGVITFLRAPDYEIPTDSDENNTYIINVIVSDGSASSTLQMTITVTDVTEATALETPDAVQTVETK